jgi:CubicO group peptidase (beta-lactamase class C family)
MMYTWPTKAFPTLALAAVACLAVHPSLAVAQTTPESQVVTTAAGNTITRPGGWSVRTDGNLLLFHAPEGDLSIAVVEVGAAKDVRAAAEAAWTRFRPTEQRAIQMITPRPGRQGWDERVNIDIDTSPNEHLELDLTALHHDGRWTVLIVDGSQSTAEKRYADISVLSQSLRPAGYKPESFLGQTPHALDNARVQLMRSFLQNAAEELEIPGLSVALIDHGKVVLEEGMGVRSLEGNGAVDPQTLFLIASNTKGMSTLLLAKLVDQGKLRWDEPVTEVYPPFRLGSKSTTASVRVRDLVCACTGLPRKDDEWIFNTPPSMSPEVTFKQLAATTPTSKFGETFQYNNQMAAAAGYIAGHLLYPKLDLGAAYDLAMKKQIFDPLQMNSTTFNFQKALASDHASPHGENVDGKTVVTNMAFDNIIVPFRPAGGAWSSAHDLIRYVGLELTKGTLPDGSRLVSENNLLIRRQRGVPTGEKQWYGMGLWEDATWGIPVIHHGGNMPGYFSDIVIVPNAQVGAVLLTNSSNGSRLMRPFRRRLLEILYDGEPEAADDVKAAAVAIRAETSHERSLITIPPDPTVISKLASQYDNAELGPLKVNKTKNGETVFIWSSARSKVATRKNPDGGTSIVTITPGIDGFEFLPGQDQGRPTLTIRDGQHVYVFESK